MLNLLKQHPDSEIVILSGEGENGTFERFTGKHTARAIKSKLARESCGGDRWARAYMQYDGDTYLNMEDVSDMREIDEEDIDD